MLNYGAACQKHFEYNEENLANATLDETQKGYGTTQDPDMVAVSQGESAYWVGSNLVTKSNIQFTLAFGGLPEGSTVTYTFTGHKGNKVTNIIPYEKIVEAGDLVMIPELVVADARCEITVSVKAVETEEIWTESIEAYLARKLEDNTDNDADLNVFIAFMKFADSAHDYLHRQEGA